MLFLSDRLLVLKRDVDETNHSDYMIVNLREAKSKLSQLVRRVAEGEEIVITVRGKPMARLTSVVPKETHASSREAWVAELLAVAESSRMDPPKSTSQEFWDELRRERTG